MMRGGCEEGALFGLTICLLGFLHIVTDTLFTDSELVMYADTLVWMP